MTVFLLSSSTDPRLPALADAVARRGLSAIPFFTDRFPTGAALQQHEGPQGARFLLDPGDGIRPIQPEDLVWVGRLEPDLPVSMPSSFREAALAECLGTLTGFLHALPCPVIEDPHRQRQAAARAPGRAAAAGLRVPRTLVTWDRALARRFAAEVHAEHPPDPDPLLPLRLQEPFPGAHPLRACVVGPRCFSDGPLQDGLARRLRALLDALGLVAATVHLLDAEGGPVFTSLQPGLPDEADEAALLGIEALADCMSDAMVAA